MPRDKTENHEKIITAAKAEFMTYGFKDASMRRIASAAGMSVSGLYKHFRDKEDMFAALVQPVYDTLFRMCRDSEAELTRSLDTLDLDQLWRSSGEISWYMTYVYDHLDAFTLLICKAEGTRYENFQHEIARMEEESTLLFIEELRKRGVRISDFSLKEFHLLTTTYIDAIFQTVRHGFTAEEAFHYAKTLDSFFIGSWKQFFGF